MHTRNHPNRRQRPQPLTAQRILDLWNAQWDGWMTDEVEVGAPGVALASADTRKREQGMGPG